MTKGKSSTSRSFSRLPPPPRTGIEVTARRAFLTGAPVQVTIDNGEPVDLGWYTPTFFALAPGEHDISIDDVGGWGGPAETCLWIDEGLVERLEFQPARWHFFPWPSRIKYLHA